VVGAVVAVAVTAVVGAVVAVAVTAVVGAVVAVAVTAVVGAVGVGAVEDELSVMEIEVTLVGTSAVAVIESGSAVG
jgi:hypothetical protein